MSSTIIIGYDGSDHAQDALALGDRLAEVVNGSLIIASVFQDDPLVGRHEYERLVREDLMTVLARARSRVGRAHVRIAVQPASSAAHGLHELAERESADLIVVGSSHRGALGRILAGSVAERLLQGSPCAVAVAPVGYAAKIDRELRVIGVGYDGSSESREAASQAAVMAEALGASLHLIAVADPSAVDAPAGAAATLVADLRAHLQGQLDEAVEVVPAGVTVKQSLVQGDAASELGAQGVDLLFCGSRGYGLTGQVLLGGTGAKVVRTAHCPVVVVPRGASRPLFPRIHANGAVQEAR